MCHASTKPKVLDSSTTTYVVGQIFQNHHLRYMKKNHLKTSTSSWIIFFQQLVDLSWFMDLNGAKILSNLPLWTCAPGFLFFGSPGLKWAPQTCKASKFSQTSGLLLFEEFFRAVSKEILWDTPQSACELHRDFGSSPNCYEFGFLLFVTPCSTTVAPEREQTCQLRGREIGLFPFPYYKAA